MRIAGGLFRGTKLQTTLPGGRKLDIRPTTARIRTAIFDQIVNGPHGNLVEGKTVLDLFAGSGAMGLEALSRGAERVVFVERSNAVAALIRRNIDITRTAAQTRVIRCDARSLPRHLATCHDLVFVDPPYARALAEPTLQNACKTGWVGPGSWVVVESQTRFEDLDWLNLVSVRSYGETVVSFGQLREGTVRKARAGEQ